MFLVPLRLIFGGPPFFSNNLFFEMLEQTKTTSDIPQKGMQEKKENKKVFSKAKSCK